MLMHPLHRRDLRVRLRMRTVADVGDDERRWVHTACVLSLRPLYCWFVDKSARHKASPYEAVMGVAATHADDDAVPPPSKRGAARALRAHARARCAPDSNAAHGLRDAAARCIHLFIHRQRS